MVREQSVWLYMTKGISGVDKNFDRWSKDLPTVLEPWYQETAEVLLVETPKTEPDIDTRRVPQLMPISDDMDK